jgi:hypothetical protein
VVGPSRELIRRRTGDFTAGRAHHRLPRKSLWTKARKPHRPGQDVSPAYRQALSVAAATGNGLLVPMGFEFAARRQMDARRSTPGDFDCALDSGVDLSDDIGAASSLVDRIAALGIAGESRALTAPGGPATTLIRFDAPDARAASAGADTCSKPLKPFKLSGSISSSVRLTSRQPPRVPMYFASKTAAMPEPVVGQIRDDRLTFRRRYGSQQFGRGCAHAGLGRGFRSGLCPRPRSDALAFPSTPPGGGAS